MRRFSHALTALLGALSMLLLPAAGAQAAGPEPTTGRAVIQIGGSLQCAVYPYLTYPPAYGQSCFSSRPSYVSTFDFRVYAPSPSYTYTWSMTGAPLPSACNSTASTCTVSVSTRGQYREVTASVVVSDGTQSSQYTAYAYGEAACPGPTGVEYC
ncbi:MAG TPA: hypothetical protein VGD67_29100 [Pseudonocardiaceae bacterium]